MILKLGPDEEMRLRQSPYMQARWHDWEAWDSPLAKEWLSLCDAALLHRLGISHLKGRHLSQLSSGEFRKARIAMALAQAPGNLILEDPYSGLDPASRQSLQTLIAGLKGVTVRLKPSPEENGLVCSMPPGPWLDPEAPEILASLSEGNVAYGGVKVIHGLNWQIQKGERWRLSGPNGSGKSTLLALLQGDHPQAYSNTISLFGKARGGGESIWDIKARLGSVSPELHAYFPRDLTLYQTVLSGFFESLGLFRQPQASQEKSADLWLEAFHLDAKRNLSFSTLSLGEQRLALLARALIKRPSLLLLDEPCQGLQGPAHQAILDSVSKLCSSNEGAVVYVSHRDDEIPVGITHTLSLAPL